LLYFCRMKRFLSYCFIFITLFTGLVSTSVFKAGSVVLLPIAAESQQSIPDQHQSFFSAGNLLISVGINNEQIRLTHSIQNISYRVLPSLLNTFRVHHSTRIVNQNFFTVCTGVLNHSANKKSDGYYLYHLRKLLI